MSDEWMTKFVTREFRGKTFKIEGQFRGPVELDIEFVVVTVPRRWWQRLLMRPASERVHARPIVRPMEAGTFGFTSIDVTEVLRGK